MTTRTTDATVKFDRSFTFTGMDDSYPPGEYLVETDEELIEQLSFPAWRRIATMIHVFKDGAVQVLTVDPRELERILSDGCEASPRLSETRPKRLSDEISKERALSRWDGEGGAPVGGR